MPGRAPGGGTLEQQLARMKALLIISIFLNAFFGFSQEDTSNIVVMDECIDIYESKASFPGGTNEFQNWFSTEVLKIKSVTELDIIKGTAQFIVNQDGRVTDVKIIEINKPEVSKSIIKILEKCPKWIPSSSITGDHPPKYYKQHIELPFEIIVK